MSLWQPSLGLPHNRYLEPGHAPRKERYARHVETVLSLIGWPDASAEAARVLRFEERAAEASWSAEEAREAGKTYNPMSISELEKFAPGFAWRPFLAGAGLAGAERLIVGEKSAFPKLAAIFADTPPATLKAWLAFRGASKSAPYLSKAFADEHFEMFGRSGGRKAPQERWRRAVAAAAGGVDANEPDVVTALRWAVGDLYAERHFSPAAKEQVERMIAHLVAAFRQRIDRLEWMDAKTKSEAKRKLDAYVFLVGRPDTPFDHGGLVVLDDDPLGNFRRAAAHEWKRATDRLAGGLDRREWFMPPQQNNGWHDRNRLAILIPAALLMPPMFDPAADPAINYGAIGGYIGHEITHGFDDQGRLVDSSGRLRDWWSKDAARAFKTRAARLARQYGAYEPVTWLRIDGHLTLGENIADLGGVGAALDAYRLSLEGRPAPVLDGTTGDQRFFFGWAQSWRGAASDGFLRNQIANGPHSPRNFRVDGVVRNIDAWYAAFGVTKSSRMYLAPKDRVRIW